jgi:proline iminopeptidase
MIYNSNIMQSDAKLKDIEDKNIIDSGRLDVGDGHSIYWVDWGNKNINNPIFYLHGGPGESFDEKSFRLFDPTKQRVIFHDQRGSGRSTPFASTQHNTTQDLISDISKLRALLGFSKISLCGFSWGSTLALLYAIENAAVVEKMLIGGIFLARQVDNDFYLQGGIASHFPEVWERFSGMVPAESRGNVGEYYKSQMFGSSETERRRFAKEWMIYESSIVKLDYQASQADDELAGFASESLAYLEAHYLLNDCFIPEDYILSNADKLKDIEVVIVHGRYDFVCMPSAAYELGKAIPHAKLQFIIAGHSRGDTVQREVVGAYIAMLWPGIDS